MVHLSTATSGFEARLLAARLGAEGVVWQLRGESSLYPLGTVEVLVDADDLDLARDLLVVADPGIGADDDGPALDDDDGHTSSACRVRWASPAVLSVVALVALALMVLRALTGV